MGDSCYSAILPHDCACVRIVYLVCSLLIELRCFRGNPLQDKDMAYWQVDFNAIRHRCAGRGAVMARHPFPDFSAEGLRHGLPTAVALLDGAFCTALPPRPRPTASALAIPAVCKHHSN